MDEISFGKVKIILLPVLLGLIIVFFLKIFSIKISFWLLVVLLLVALLVSSSLTSKLPTKNTIFVVLAVLVAISTIVILILAIWPDSRQETNLENGSLVKDQFNNKWICGDVEFKKIDITTKSPNYKFSLLNLKGGKAKVTVTFEEVGLQKSEFSFLAGNSEEIQFGARDNVYAFVNGVDLVKKESIDKMNFFTDGQKYTVTVKIESGKSCELWKSSRFYQRGDNVVDRNDLLNLNMIGLIKFDF